VPNVGIEMHLVKHTNHQTIINITKYNCMAFDAKIQNVDPF
jgi:hypothetical protein